MKVMNLNTFSFEMQLDGWQRAMHSMAERIAFLNRRFVLLLGYLIYHFSLSEPIREGKLGSS